MGYNSKTIKNYKAIENYQPVDTQNVKAESIQNVEELKIFFILYPDMDNYLSSVQIYCYKRYASKHNSIFCFKISTISRSPYPLYPSFEKTSMHTKRYLYPSLNFCMLCMSARSICQRSSMPLTMTRFLLKWR